MKLTYKELPITDNENPDISLTPIKEDDGEILFVMIDEKENQSAGVRFTREVLLKLGFTLEQIHRVYDKGTTNFKILPEKCQN